jgi:hypothetical protein
LRLGRFTPEEKDPVTHWIECWVGLRASLDYVEKRKFLTLPGFELRPLRCPARSQSLANGVYVEDRVQEFLICDLDFLQFIDAEVKQSLAYMVRNVLHLSSRPLRDKCEK